MRVLITGGDGFLGSHLLARLHEDGFEPFVAPARDYDLTAAAEARCLFDDARPEVVVHLAEEVGGNDRYTNLAIAAQVLDQSRLHEVKKLVGVGTIRQFARSASRCREQSGLHAIHVLPVELFGPGDRATSHVVRALIGFMTVARQLGVDEVALPGDGSPTRDLLYVEDAAEGIALALERYDGDEPVNLGTGTETSMGQLAELVAEVIGFRGAIVWEASVPNGQPSPRLDAGRACAQSAFGFRARTTLREGIERTVDWYRADAAAALAA